MASIPPRSSGAIPPIRIPHAFLPLLPSVMPSTFSFPSPLLLSTPALSPFSLPPLLNLGKWIQPRIKIANLDVRTCILMCIMLKTITEHYVKHGSPVTISALDISKAFDTVDRYALLNYVNG